jgi:nicotinamide-nucleotide amidase
MVEDQAEKIIDILDDLVYGRNDETLAQVVGNELIRWKKTLSVAESCTGGLITKMLTDKPGSSEFFTHGWITYSNEAKMSELRIDRKLIEEHGAVSQEVASAMAESARKKAGTDYAVAVTGIAGPTGGSEQKPVGLVYIAVVSPRRQFVKRYVFSYTREHIRQRAALTALNMLRKELRI